MPRARNICAVVPVKETGLAKQRLAELTIVTVVPVTHTPPADPVAAIEIPPAIKAHLGLDQAPTWIVISEVNDFVWPGPDLRPIPGKSPPRVEYGVLPPRFFKRVRDQLIALREARRSRTVVRDE